MRSLLISMSAAIGLAAPSAAEITARPIPADAFAQVPNIQSVSMSEEGDLIVALVADPNSNNEHTALATWDLSDDSMPVTITPSGNRMEFIAASALKAGRIWVVGRQEWTGRLGGCGEGRVTGATETFVTKQYLTDPQHTEFEDAFSSNVRSIGVSDAIQRCFEIAGDAGLVNTLPLDPNHVLVQQSRIGRGTSYIYRYNLETGDTELWHRTGGGSSPAYFNPRDGELLVQSRIENDGDDYRLETLIKNPQTGEFEVHAELTSMASQRFNVNIAGLDEATGNYYVVTDKFSDLAQIYFYDPVARTFSDGPILAHPEYSATGVVLGSDPENFNELLGFTYSGPSNAIYWLDPNLDQLRTSLAGLFPDTNVSVMDWTPDYRTILFQTGNGADPASYYILRNFNDLRLLGHSRPWLDNYPMARPELVHFDARDGLEIPGVLTVPAGWSRDDGPLPTIVLPHGGPWARDFTSWDGSGWPQFLASRGYAVLQPQYRGSTGFGRELWLSGDAQWGLTMQDDKDDAAAWLVEQGIAHPDRLAIFGYSYGGFAAFAATVRENGPFQCAIAGAGVSNLTRLGNNWSDNPLQRVIQGRTVTGMDPIENTERANIPILIYHGDRDVRVPLFHSTSFYNAVQNRVDAELLVIEDMPHSLPWYPRHHRETLGAIERFLAEDCGPGGL